MVDKNFGKKNKNFDPVWVMVAALGFILFIGLSIWQAHSVSILLDEGSYLYKGEMFLTGKASPYQVDGLITNKSPLSFFIPGISQVLFTPGIRSGRYFSIFIGALMLVGLWMSVRRVTNLKWAAVSVWMVALNLNWVTYYVRAMTQVISICFLVWAIYFLFGDKKKIWELVVGGFVAILVVLTRQNMIPFVLIIYVYLVWQYGLKKTIYTQLPAVILFIVVNIVYWPGIYIFVWRALLPSFVSEFLISQHWLGNYVGVKLLNKVYPEDFGLIQNIQAIFGGFRYSAISYIIAILLVTLYPFKKAFSDERAKQVTTLVVVFIVLTIVHIFAVSENNVFLYSFPGYIAFFSPIIIIAGAMAIKDLSTEDSILRTIVGSTLIVTLFGGFGLHIHTSLSTPIIHWVIPPIFSRSNGKIELWQLITNKFGWEIPAQGYIFSALAGISIGLAFLAISGIIWLLLLKNKKIGYIYFASVMFFGLSFFAIPTTLLTPRAAFHPCEDDVIKTFERSSLKLSKMIPPGSTLFWDTDTEPSPAMLLYMPDVKIFPSQINGRFYYKDQKNFEGALQPFAWSKEIGLEWLKNSDYAVFSEKTIGDWDTFLTESKEPAYGQISHTDLTFACNSHSYGLVYRRK